MFANDIVLHPTPTPHSILIIDSPLTSAIGVVWCGVVWCGVGVVWCGVVWCGGVGCGVGWGGVGWGWVVCDVGCSDGGDGGGGGDYLTIDYPRVALEFHISA